MEELIKLDEYCSSVRDGTHDTPKPTEAGFFLVTSRAVKNNSIDFCSCYYISEKDYNKINERSKVDKWDVLMTMIGTVGRLLLVKDEPEYAIKNMALFKVGNEDRAKWLYYYLSTSAIQSYFEMIASGTSQHFIGLGHLRNLKIEDYNHASKRITDILSTFDSLIELNNKRVKALEQMAENLYKEWFVRFRFPGHENAEFENGIPKGWKTRRFSSVANILSGGTPKTEYEEYYGGQIPFYTPKDSSENFFVFDTITKLTEDGLRHCNSQLYPQNTIMITARGTVGNLNLLAVPMAMNQSCYALNSDTISSQYFLFFLIKREIQKIKKMASGGVFDTIIVNTFDHIKVLLPTDELINKFDLIVSSIMKEVYSLSKQNINLIKQRDLLLPRLMSGKLEV